MEEELIKKFFEKKDDIKSLYYLDKIFMLDTYVNDLLRYILNYTSVTKDLEKKEQYIMLYKEIIHTRNSEVKTANISHHKIWKKNAAKEKRRDEYKQDLDSAKEMIDANFTYAVNNQLTN